MKPPQGSYQASQGYTDVQPPQGIYQASNGYDNIQLRQGSYHVSNGYQADSLYPRSPNSQYVVGHGQQPGPRHSTREHDERQILELKTSYKQTMRDDSHVPPDNDHIGTNKSK